MLYVQLERAEEALVHPLELADVCLALQARINPMQQLRGHNIGGFSRLTRARQAVALLIL